MATSYDEVRRLGPFDAVVCDNVLEHMPMPSEAIAFLWSVTRPGAVLYVSVPNHDEAFIALQSELFSAGRALDMSLNPWEHLNYFDLAHLDGLLARGGFQPVARTSLPGEVRIGLRAEADLGRRIRNSLASALRLARYAMTMQTVRSVNEEFYVRSGSG